MAKTLTTACTAMAECFRSRWGGSARRQDEGHTDEGRTDEGRTIDQRSKNVGSICLR